MAISLTNTSRTSNDDNDFADVVANDQDLIDEFDARDSVYRTILATVGASGSDTASGTYAFAAFASPIASGTASSAAHAIPTFYFDDTDYSVASKTQKLRLRAQVNTNATAWSSVTATFGLYPVTFAGAADTLAATLGTVVSGSTVAIANPSASSVNQGTSGDFTIPADGQYALGVVFSATLTNNAYAQLAVQLQSRYV